MRNVPRMLGPGDVSGIIQKALGQMNISRKLSNRIRAAISKANQSSLDAIDKAYRSGQITHEVWADLHKVAVSADIAAQAAATNEIAIYRR